MDLGLRLVGYEMDGMGMMNVMGNVGSYIYKNPELKSTNTLQELDQMVTNSGIASHRSRLGYADSR